MAKKVTYHYKSKKGFAKKARAAYVKVGNKKYILPRDKKAREKVIARAEKYATKPTFSDKIKEQGLRAATSQPTQARYFSENKTLNVPGKKGATFDIEKNTYELKRPSKITDRTVKKRVEKFRRHAYKKMLKTWEANKGKNFLFRIDTAYVDENGQFAKVDGVFKKDKQGDSDGRGYSMGRYLNITSKKKFLKYLDDTFYGFFKAFETYSARNGINAGQINALILEVS